MLLPDDHAYAARHAAAYARDQECDAERAEAYARHYLEVVRDASTLDECPSHRDTFFKWSQDNAEE